MMTLRAGQRHLSIPGFGVTVSGRAVQSAAADWWAVAGRTCVAAYQPKGAATYAASKSNLASPGTGDASDGAAYPTWDATNGWMFDATSSQYLITSALGNAYQTVVFRYSNAGNGNERTGVVGFDIGPRWFGDALYVHGGLAIVSGGGQTSGTSGIAGQQPYRNGSAHGSAIDGGTTYAYPTLIGARSGSGVAPYTPSGYCTFYVQAWIAIQEALNGTEMAALHAVMAAL